MFRPQDRKKCEELFNRYYKNRKFSRTQYRDLILDHVRPGDSVLDAGCGRHLEFAQELGRDVRVFGVDLCRAMATTNSHAPYGICGNLERLPFADNSFDLVISRSVIEHLADPALVFRDFHRVLKPGGKVIFATPNKYDYVSVFASITPYTWHRKIVSKVVGVDEDDVFPTLYRANTLSSLGRELRQTGFNEIELRTINHYPVYLMFSPLLFRLGVLYERLTSVHALRSLRGTLLCVFQKQGAVSSRSVGASEKLSRPELVRR